MLSSQKGSSHKGATGAGVVAVGLLLAASCSDDGAEQRTSTADAGDGAATEAGVDGAVDAAEGSSPSGVGEPCTAPGPFQQGTCADGLVCTPMAGGYCTRPCGFGACPSDSSCVPSPSLGELCATSCSADSDCREADGYVCDVQWKACVQWLLSPKLAACAAGPALPRKTFGTVAQLSTSGGPGQYQAEPGAALDASGSLTTVYMARNDIGQSNGLGVATISSSGAIDGDRTFAVSSKEAFDPWMAADRSGKLHLVWYGHDGLDVNGVIGYATSSDGKSWTSEKNVLWPADCPGSSAGCTDKPMIAIGPSVTDLAKDVVYVFYFAGGSERVTRSLDGGATFEPSVGVAIGTYGDAEVASDGSVHTVAIGGGGGNKLGAAGWDVLYSKSTDDGQSFTAPVHVEAPDELVPFYFSNPQVVYNPTLGSVHVVYPAGTPDGEWVIRLASSKDAGATWSRITVNDDPACANHATPTIALDPTSGKLHIAWIENRGGVGRVAYTSCVADGSTCSANEAISDEFASYQLVRHSPQWLGEYFSLLVDSTKNEIHAVWTQTVDENGKPTSRIFHAKGSL